MNRGAMLPAKARFRFVGLALLLAGLAQAGATENVTREIDGERWTITELAHERFGDAGWRERWKLEGNATLETKDGRLAIVTSDAPGVEPAATLWWAHALPADILIEATAGVDGPAENNAANLNLMLHASESDGPYRFGRSGRYGEYQEIPNYIVTLTGGFQEGWSRVRRNPGFEQLSEEPATRSEVGRTYRIRVLLAGGRLRYWLDGRLIHDVRDPRPLAGGHFALRTWRSRVWWTDILIAGVRPVERE